MIKGLVAISYLTFLILAMVMILLAIFHFMKMIANIRGDRSIHANIAAPFVVLFSSVFNADGNYHRKRFFLYCIGFLLCLIVLLITSVYMAV